MTPVWTLFTLWVGLALIASLLSVWGCFNPGRS